MPGSKAIYAMSASKYSGSKLGQHYNSYYFYLGRLANDKRIVSSPEGIPLFASTFHGEFAFVKPDNIVS